jgi:hypothetical protein
MTRAKSSSVNIFLKKREMICETVRHYIKMNVGDEFTHPINFDNFGTPTIGCGTHRWFHEKLRTSIESVATKKLKSSK